MMERPFISNDNQVIAQQRRANREITKGIEDKISSLHILNAWERVKEFAFFIGLYLTGAGITYLGSGNILVILIAIILMGIALNSLPILIHEGLHGLFANNRKLNHFISFLVGVPIVISATAYKTTHNNHHYELGRKLDYGTYRQHVRKPIFIWIAYFFQLMMGTIFYIMLIPFLGYKSASKRSRFFIVAEYIVITIIFAIFFKFVAIGTILLFWIYPMLVVNVLTNVRGLASHALSDVENIYLSSRTVSCSKFVSFLFLNENYHLEHHLFPRAPSYNLPKIHALIWHRLPEAIYSKSYILFLLAFFKSAVRGKLGPQGIVRPNKKQFLQ